MTVVSFWKYENNIIITNMVTPITIDKLIICETRNCSLLILFSISVLLKLKNSSISTSLIDVYKLVKNLNKIRIEIR
jgi:hypothetical protein